MDVYDQARAEVVTLTDRQLRRGFKKARASRIEYYELGEDESVTFAAWFIDLLLDTYNDRHPEKRRRP